MGGGVMTMIARRLEGSIRELMESRPAILIVGPRGAGKTTVLGNFGVGERTYAALSDEETRNLAEKEPDSFFERYPAPLIIDEVQRSPVLVQALKEKIEKGRPGDFLLAASWMTRELEELIPALSGKLEKLTLLPLSQAELHGLEIPPFDPSAEMDGAPCSSDAVYKEIWTGAMPAVRSGEKARNVFYAEYILKVIEEDMRKFVRLRNERKFLDFLMVLAAWDGQSVNFDGLAREAKVNTLTARKWVQVLEKLGHIYFLRPLLHPALKRAVRTPKLYFTDTGLVCYLRNRPSPASVMTGAMKDVLLENFAVNEIRKSYFYHGKVPPLSYYRDIDRKEIQVVFIGESTLYPVKILKTVHPAPGNGADFPVLDQTGIPRGKGTILCLTIRKKELGKNLTGLPVTVLG